LFYEIHVICNIYIYIYAGNTSGGYSGYGKSGHSGYGTHTGYGKHTGYGGHSDYLAMAKNILQATVNPVVMKQNLSHYIIQKHL
jgi:hypothetical protein